MGDALHGLVHDHSDINRRVIALATSIRHLERGHTDVSSAVLHAGLAELREILFLHFAREEEGLFPFVADIAPDLEERLDEMQMAHDLICGSLARMVHLTLSRAAVATVFPIFERFEAAYSQHARTEAELFEALQARLTPEQREKLAALVDGL